MSDYLPIHQFIDCTKSLCADNRHRLLHTHWALDNILLPLFGHRLINSDGRVVPVKEMIERDHFLPDYRNRFIPTLNDFVQAIDEDDLGDLIKRIDTFHSEHANSELSQLMLSPLTVTGKLKSLLVTHNSWFVNSILPLLFSTSVPIITEFGVTPNDLFDRMRFEPWMENGADFSPSARQVSEQFEQVG